LLRGCRRYVFMPQMTRMNTDAELRGWRRYGFFAPPALPAEVVGSDLPDWW